MIRMAIVFSAVALGACSTADKRRVVNVTEPTPVQTSQVRFDAPEAQAACDTRKMRKRALDADSTNDIASVTVVRELSPGRRTETDIDVNCRDYFASRLGGRASALPAPAAAPAQPTVIVTRASAPSETIEVRTVTPTRSYRVRRGDTLYDIARDHCTGWKTLADENGLRNAAHIKPGQLLRLPEGGC